MSLLEQTQAKLESEARERHRLEQLVIAKDREISRLRRAKSSDEHERLASIATKLVHAVDPNYSGDLPAALYVLEGCLRAEDLVLFEDLRDALHKLSRAS